MCAGKGLLAVDENFGHVAQCGCGTLHVSVGPVSVALDAKALRRLHELLARRSSDWIQEPRSWSSPNRCSCIHRICHCEKS